MAQDVATFSTAQGAGCILVLLPTPSRPARADLKTTESHHSRGNHRPLPSEHQGDA
ncbi:hypothetical protein [Desulfonatronum thiosulfatophilum]|uniref:hypothetical protein n=1 Tax=Desulfonatronum thiosulfatophilum TaxID=617002 RepID=UPI001ABF2E37